MKILPKEIEDTLPELYSTENTLLQNKILHIRYISIFSNWEWYVIEYDKTTKIFFGYVKGFESELGYFSLTEFEELNNDSLQIIRDESFTPRTFKEL